MLKETLFSLASWLIVAAAVPMTAQLIPLLWRQRRPAFAIPRRERVRRADESDRPA